jgi:ADP-heptose:LPS heptosyltransferase
MGPVAAAAGIPCRIGFAQPRTRPFLTIKLPEPGPCHAAELALQPVAALISWLGLASDPPPLRGHGGIRLEERHRVEAARALQDMEERTGPCPIIIHPGTGWDLKNWPAVRWGEVAHAIDRRFGVTPLVLGSLDERDLVDAAISAAHGCAVSLARTLSVGALAALHRASRLVIGADSGPLHLAALVGTPVVGLYGPADPAQFAPLSEPRDVRLVRVDLPCSPCGTLLHPPCGVALEPACVMGITVDAVTEAASELLLTPASRHTDYIHE